jgi:predicted nucleic acid-binding protein
MLIADLPNNSRVFCDANVLAYAFLGAEPVSSVCLALLERCARREVQLFTSAIQASNLIHRSMVREAVLVLGLEPRKVVSHLKQHPDVVRKLNRYKALPGELGRTRLHILDVTYREIHASKRYRDEYGLLTDDSITLAVMERHGFMDLASNDEDFKRIKNIRLWMPD